MFLKNNVSKIILAVCPIILFGLGYLSGSAVTENKYLKKLKEQADYIEKKRIEYRQETEQHQKNQVLLRDEIYELQKKYDSDVVTLKSDFVNRMLESEKRGDIYRARFEAESAECRDLSQQAARLDRSLTEGRELVKELKRSVEQCRMIAVKNIEFLINDRNHLNGN